MCGAEQPAGTTGPAQWEAGAGRPRPVFKKQSAAKKALPAVLLVVGLAAIGGLAVALAPDTADNAVPSAGPVVTATTPPAPSAPKDPNDLGIVDRQAASPTDAFTRAQARALTWNRDEVLVSITVEGVRGPTIDLTSEGKFTFEFGLPSGVGFGTGAELDERRLFIEAGETDQVAERTGAPDARAALDPGCHFEAAVKAFHASGVDPDTPMMVRYRLTKQHGRPVWSAEPPTGAARFADGQRCALLVR